MCLALCKKQTYKWNSLGGLSPSWDQCVICTGTYAVLTHRNHGRAQLIKQHFHCSRVLAPRLTKQHTKHTLDKT